MQEEQAPQKPEKNIPPKKSSLWKPICFFLFFLALVGTAFAIVKYRPDLLPQFARDDGAQASGENGAGSGGAESSAVETPEPLYRPVSMPVAPSALGELEISPAKFSEQGVALDSHFLIHSKETLSKSELIETLSVKSGEAFQIDEAGSNEFDLSFAQPLAPDQVYRFLYSPLGRQPLSFAFQTISGFRIVSSTPDSRPDNRPDNKAYNVPIDSGIEITFSEAPANIAADNFSAFFEIEPRTAGKFEQVGNTVIFQPEGLQYDAEYTVTVRGGIANVAGQTMGKDYQFSFHTQWRDESAVCTVWGDVYESFLPDEEISVRLFAGEDVQNNDFDVILYDLKSPDEFIRYYEENQNNAPAPETGLLLKTLRTQLYIVDNGGPDQNQYFLMLHETLPEGYYLLHIRTVHDGQNVMINKLIQVSRLSVYSVALNGEACFWVNDASSGKPAAGAHIEMGATGATGATGAASVAGVTDAEGKLILTMQADAASVTKIDFAPAPVFVYLNQTFDARPLPIQEKFLHYMYTDREEYQPDDTIDVFGVIQPRSGAFQIGADDTITLSLGEIVRLPVELDGYGCFHHRINISDMRGSVSLSAEVNGESLMSVGVRFSEYPKDKYFITARTDRFVYLTGEDAQASLQVSTFDNAPVEGVKLDYENEPLLTDANGNAAKTISIPDFEVNPDYPDDYPDWRPRPFDLTFSAIFNNAQSASAHVIVLPSDVMVENTILSENSIEFVSSQIDREAIEQAQKAGQPYDLTPDLYRGASINMDFTFEIRQRIFTRVKTGESYDYIQKRNADEYRYDQEEKTYSTQTVHTIDGKAALNDLPVSADPLISYYGVLTFQDTRGKTLSEEIFFGGSFTPPYANASRNYYFEMRRKGQDEQEPAGVNRLQMNETADLWLNYYSAVRTGDISTGKIIAIVTHDKILNASVGSPRGLPFTFTEDCVDNVYIFGAYFDGKRAFPVQYPMLAVYDQEERTLAVEVTPDKDAYQPGGSVQLTIKTADRDGRPKQSLVSISVVDEAAFSLSEHSAGDFAAQWYGSVLYTNPEYYVYSSYARQEFSSSGSFAERGSGGGETLFRKDFRDNPAFETVETDASGTAVVSFKLSDSITSWRVTTHAVTADQYAGNTRNNLLASLPFSIDLILADTFVMGDEVSLWAAPQGEAYRFGQTEIAYALTILGEEEEEIFADRASSPYAVAFNAGKLPEGTYKVQVEAASAGADVPTLQDAMETSIAVAGSGVRLNITDRETLTPDHLRLNTLGVLNSPVQVILSNADLSFFSDILESCMITDSRRTDYLAAAAFGADYLNGLSALGNPNSLTRLKSELPWGVYGVPETLYGGSDPVYAARFAACFPELIRSDLLYAAARNALNRPDALDEPDDRPGVSSESEEAALDEDAFEMNRAAGYLMLAADDRPYEANVLLEMQRQVDLIRNAPDQEKFTARYESQARVLLYAAALCVIGDDGAADQLTRAYPLSADRQWDETDPKENRRRRELLEALQLFTRTTLNPEAAYTFLREKEDNKYVSDVCEKIHFIRSVTPAEGLLSEVSYVLNGEEKITPLRNFDRPLLTLTKEQFSNLTLRPVSGRTAAEIHYTGRATELDPRQSKIGLVKNIQPAPEGGDKIYAISFEAEMPSEALKGFYTIRDRIPSNMRFTESLAAPGGQPQDISLVLAEKQIVDITFYYDGEAPNRFEYWAVQVSDAEAVTEKAYISQNFRRDQIWGASQ
ncbi:MAG: Ig-like domain-containing protein [Clostridiales bacterium]|nr:Ig-like domain-containing protein [Clostridiales bacterium]